MPDNIVALPGCRAPSAEPNDMLVRTLASMLEDAKSGRLQSLLGVGFMSDGARLAVWADFHTNVYEMAGSLAWLQAEYVHRHTGGKA